MAPRGYRDCPFCAEPAREAAKVCPHCRRDLPPMTWGLRKSSRRRWLVGLGIIALLVVFARGGGEGAKDRQEADAVPLPSAAKAAIAVTTPADEPPQAEITAAPEPVPVDDGFSYSVNKAVVEGLRPKRAECLAAMHKVERGGVFRNRRTSAGATWVDCDESLWRRMEYDTKMRIALVIYCATMPPNGEHTVMIRGLRSGKILGSIVDGHWSD